MLIMLTGTSSMVCVACDAEKLAKPIALAHAAARKLVRVLACMCVCVLISPKLVLRM